MSKKAFYGKEDERFFKFLCKLHERLYIILDDNIAKGVDPVEVDIELLKHLYKLHDTIDIAWLKDEAVEEQVVSEQKLFSDTLSDNNNRSGS